MDRIAQLIITETLAEMSRISGATADEILSVVAADPHGATARRFFEYLALGIKAAELVAA